MRHIIIQYLIAAPLLHLIWFASVTIKSFQLMPAQHDQARLTSSVQWSPLLNKYLLATRLLIMNLVIRDH